MVSELPCISEFLLKDTLSFLSNEVIISWKQEMKKKEEEEERTCRSYSESFDIINIVPNYWFDPCQSQNG